MIMPSITRVLTFEEFSARPPLPKLSTAYQPQDDDLTTDPDDSYNSREVSIEDCEKIDTILSQLKTVFTNMLRGRPNDDVKLALIYCKVVEICISERQASILAAITGHHSVGKSMLLSATLHCPDLAKSDVTSGTSVTLAPTRYTCGSSLKEDQDLFSVKIQFKSSMELRILIARLVEKWWQVHHAASLDEEQDGEASLLGPKKTLKPKNRKRRLILLQSSCAGSAGQGMILPLLFQITA